ncbi:MAG: peptidase S8 [Clostridium sp.]|nr:peptidase S8 [Clostridium sp.]
MLKFLFNNVPAYIFNNPSYARYVAEYQGDIISEAPLGLAKNIYITVLNAKYVIITKEFSDVMDDRLTLQNIPFPSVVFIDRYYIYCTLDTMDFTEKVSINPIEAANINVISSLESINLTGKGTVVGIIDTGIDYLNKEFQTKDGDTRILRIWDQSLLGKDGNGEENASWGVEYTKEQINNALNAYRAGEDPYSIVESKDELGHGTAMAGVIGASGFDPEIRGAAPECEFVIVKLSRDLVSEIITQSKELYDMASIMAAINYIFMFALESDKPTVIYMPFGTTLGNHRFNGVLENYIDEVCNNLGVTVVTSSGDEGDARNHDFSIIQKIGDIEETQIYVDKEQKFLMLDLVARKPNKMSIDIISPSGESTGIIEALLKQKEMSKFVIEGTQILTQYYIPDDLSGDEVISVYFFDLQPGIWKIRVYGNYILDGRYDIWLLSKKMLKGGTSLTSSSTSGTITNPSISRYSLTVSNYNQNNITVYPKSGVAITEMESYQIDVAAGGVDLKCIYLNNGRVYITGTSVSAAVATGAALLLFEWGIVQGNDPYMYSQTIKSYMVKRTYRRKNDIYPNVEWGYGILDLLGIFTNL